MTLIFGIGQPPISAQIRIQGLVTDAENRGIASVSVGIPGTRFGTATSSDGRFELAADDSEIPSDEIHIAFRPNRPNGLYQGILILDRFLWQIKSVELRKTSFYSSWMSKEVTASGRIAYQLVDHRVSEIIESIRIRAM
jgi:hypothetical protein